jgi:tRNA(Ile)-lysidine synthase
VRTPLQVKLLTALREDRLAAPGETLLVAVSGGADSTCLLHGLAALREDLQIDLRAAHLNHQLRPAAKADEDYVKHVCAQIDVPLTSESYYVKEYQAAHRLTPEEAAREVRYQFLARVSAQVGAARVLVAHTADDDAETVLLHLLRGSGLAGLEGLKALSMWRSTLTDAQVELGRPLLGFSRADTQSYCEHFSLSPCEDETNFDPAFLRNRVRHELIPHLETFNPAIREALHRLGHLAGEDLALLDAETERLWQALAQVTEDSITFKREDIAALAAPLKRRLLRRALEELRGSLKDIEWRHLKDMLELLEKPAGKRLNLPGGLLMVMDYDTLRLSRAEAAVPYPSLPEISRLEVPGVTRVSGWTIRASLESKEVNGDATPTDNYTAQLDAAVTGNSLYVRARQRGDSFQPLGMQGSKKVSRFLIDTKVPEAWRDRIPIVTDGENIVWLVGQRIDARYRVTPETRRVLHLEFKLD